MSPAPQGITRIRFRHDDSAPHKEYFQTPGNEPKPDLTPYNRDSRQSYPPRSQPSSIPSPLNTTVEAAGQQNPPRPRGWQRLPRAVRSIIWAILFLELGTIAAVALVTWDYIAPPFEPGSPEDQELVEEILDVLDTHPMVEGLRDNEWIEVDAFTPDLLRGMKGRSLVYQVLGMNNSQGIFVKLFHHPTLEFTMMVFFLGFGIEGWPDVVHGGIITTLLQEGLGKHIAYYHSGFSTSPDVQTDITFKKPCKPGTVYGVLIAPSGRDLVPVGNLQLTQLKMTGLFVQLEGAPVVSSEYDVRTGVELLQVGIPSRRGDEPTHAVCQAQVKLIPKHYDQAGNAFEIGGNEGFGKALDFLKKRPEFRDTQQTSAEEKTKDD